MRGFSEGFEGPTDARCLNPGATDFNTYVSVCRTSSDIARANTFFSNSTQVYKDTFQKLRAQFDDLLVTGDASNTMAELAGSTTTQTNTELNSLSKKKDVLMAEIDGYRRQAESADKSFLEDVLHGTPKEELVPTLQDATLLLFWAGYLILAVTLVLVRFGSPGGGWRAGLVALVIMLLVTLVLFALLRQVA
jgi:hypothetical protein